VARFFLPAPGHDRFLHYHGEITEAAKPSWNPGHSHQAGITGNPFFVQIPAGFAGLLPLQESDIKGPGLYSFSIPAYYLLVINRINSTAMG
jgi:hypothetical protein